MFGALSGPITREVVRALTEGANSPIKRLIEETLRGEAGEELIRILYDSLSAETARRPLKQPLDMEAFRTSVESIVHARVQHYARQLDGIRGDLDAVQGGNFEGLRIVPELLEELEAELTSRNQALARVEEILSHVSELEAQWQGRLADLDMEVVARETARKKFRRRRVRVEEAIRAAKVQPDRPSSVDGLSPEELQRRLADASFLATEALCRRLLSALASPKRILVIEGPPGSGKSTLARLLPKVLMGETCEPVFESVEAAWTSFHLIGSQEFEANQLGPSFGPLTRAVLEHIETNGKRWLVLDEANRANPGVYLGKLLNALSPENDAPTINHPDALFEADDREARIPIPRGFRILCTQNPHDTSGIYRWGQPWKRRSAFITIDEMAIPTLEHFLTLTKLEPYEAANPKGWATIATDARKGVHYLLRVVELVRELIEGAPEATIEVRDAIMSASEAAATVSSLLRELESGSRLVNALDFAMLENVVEKLRDATLEVRHTVRDQVFDQLPVRLSRCVSALSEEPV